MFEEILYDLHAFLGECVFVPKKINNQFWGLTVFTMKVTFLGRVTKRHISPKKILSEKLTIQHEEDKDEAKSEEEQK